MNLPKYRGNNWRHARRYMFPVMGFYDIFLTSCQEDMRISYNYYRWKQPKLQEHEGYHQRIESNMAAMIPSMDQKIIPAELRGEGRERYVNIPEKYAHERDWEAERKHGQLWEQMNEDEAKYDRMMQYYKKEDNKLHYDILLDFRAKHKTGTVPYKRIAAEHPLPEDIKLAYEASKQEEKEKQKEENEKEKEKEVGESEMTRAEEIMQKKAAAGDSKPAWYRTLFPKAITKSK